MDPVLDTPQGAMSSMDATTLLRFASVGVATAALYYALLACGVEIFRLHAVIASCIAYLAAVAVNYLLHFHWTYKTSDEHRTVAARYTAMILTGFVLNGTLMWLGVTVLSINYLISQAAAMLAVICLNLVLSSQWVFKNSSRAEP